MTSKKITFNQNKPTYLLNAFSLQMLEDVNSVLKIEEISIEDIANFYVILEDGGKVFGDDIAKYQNYHTRQNGYEITHKLTSAIGHQDTARVLEVPMNRVNVTLSKGDVAYVAQLQGGRLPEGSTTLPEGFSFKFLKVTVS